MVKSIVTNVDWETIVDAYKVSPDSGRANGRRSLSIMLDMRGANPRPHRDLYPELVKAYHALHPGGRSCPTSRAPVHFMRMVILSWKCILAFAKSAHFCALN